MEVTALGTPDNSDFRLLTALAEELKQPLLQLARTAELHGDHASELTADMALRLIDGYVLGLQTNGQTSLNLEPVTISSVLHDTAAILDPFAKQQGYDIRLDIGGRYGPVMGARRLLEQAYTLLGYEIMSAPVEDGAPTITLATHKSHQGIVAGIFTDNTLLTADAYRRARVLVGSAKQTLPSGTYGNGAGIFIADSLVRSLASNFKVARHQKQKGLAATFLLSRQLQLV